MIRTIKQHEEKYWHIPKFKIGLLSLLILSLFITFGYSFIFINEWNLHNISFVISCRYDECDSINYTSLGFILHLIFTYLLISFNFIVLTALLKRGFHNLKGNNDEGLIGGLNVGLIGGLMSGLIVGLMSGLIVGLIGGLIVGLIGEFGDEE